jgi:hypothetical protein
MPKADWGLSAGTVTDFDRDKQFTPYQGPLPPNAVYKWRVVNAYYAAATDTNLPQLRLLLSLVPRDRSENKYSGFMCMAMAPVGDNTAFRYVPFLDAIGATEADFRRRTDVDAEGKIRKIGKWVNNGKTEVAAQLEDNDYEKSKYPKSIGWVGALAEYEPDDEEDEEEYEDDEEEYEDDTEEEEEYEDEEEEEPEPPRRTRKATTTRRARR